MIAAAEVASAVRGVMLRSRSLPRSWLVIAVIASIVLILPFLFPLDGHSHADWLQFLGRFHPLLVHIPIGLIVLLPVLELAGARRPSLREAGGLVLFIAAAACVVTLCFGLILAYASGEIGRTVTWHLRGGIVLTLELLLCAGLRPLWTDGKMDSAYPALLCATLLTLAWTAHQGGSLTHGGDYLTRYMPAVLKRYVAPSAIAEHPRSFFARHIYPVLDTKCVACHGTNKEQGGLRLDSYEALMAGGKDGKAIVPGSPEKSRLLQKVTLPPSDPHFMPAEGKPSLTPVEIARIHAWVAAGASAEASNVPGIFIAEDREEPPPVGDYSSMMNEIERMRQSQGAKLVAVSAKPSDGLILRTVDVAATFDDRQLASFQRFAPYIVEAELGRTAVTDNSLEILGHFTHLRSLHLENTLVSGRSLDKLAGLAELRYLNLSGTKVTNEGLRSLKKMVNLRNIYLFNTPAEPVASAAEVNRSSQ